MRTALVFTVLLGCVATFLSCVPKGQLRTRAAFDLSCPEDQLTLSDLGRPTVQGVSGCGRKASYVYVNGTWVMNSDSQPQSRP